jgi:phosphate transport system substrate-binding protein
MVARAATRLLLIALSFLAPLSASAQWFSGSGFAGAGLTGAGFIGAGSTFAHPILIQWGRAFATQQGEGGAMVDGDGGLDYEPVGSLGGVVRAINRAVEFGASDVAMLPEEVARNGLIQFPFVMGGVAVATNLPGTATNTLRLSGAALAGIYLGEITRWNDPALVALNPDVRLPDAAIVVVRREDGSGTTYHFANYLANASPVWREKVGVDTLLNWPVGRGARGNEGVGIAVRDTPHAIGYIELGQATRLGLSIARLQNAAGRFIAPTRDSLQEASATATWDPARHFHDARPAPTGETAYPITATVYALMPQRPRSGARARRALAFFQLALSERAADASTLGYVPLPEPVVAQVIAYWRTNLGR